MEFTGKKSVITPEGVFIIGTYDENGMPNAMNAAWGMQSDIGEIKRRIISNFIVISASMRLTTGI